MSHLGKCSAVLVNKTQLIINLIKLIEII